MIGALFSMYRPRFARSIVYMLQSTEYQVWPYLKWFWRTTNFARVMHRRQLVMTKPARMLLRALRFGLLAQIGIALGLGLWGIRAHKAGVPQIAFALLVAAPIIWAHLIVLPLLLGRVFVIWPRNFKNVRRSADVFAAHSAMKIAVAGSYGKTSMKEILATVLGEGKKVAATAANKNVASEHAKFAARLKGDEEVLIIEYGEGKPGDVKRFVRTTHPRIGIITGLAPAHLDKYKTLERAGQDIFSLAGYLDHKNVFVNSESVAAAGFIKKADHPYSAKGVLDWQVINPKVSIEGLSFMLKNGDGVVLRLRSKLLGRHQIGPLALAAVLAHQGGIPKTKIEAGVAKTEPFAHRLQPRQLGGAWIIDDTYNGNIDGLKVGLELLKELPAKRKIYVTPGLVDQGKDSPKIHHDLGLMIARAKPDQVVLMDNSVTESILGGLKAGGFVRQVTIERDPLEFYTNLGHFVAAGDLILMQNDWTDNYA